MDRPIGETITLTKLWYVSSLIGKGGIGAVYRATSELEGTYALKLIGKAPGADRELLFGDDLSQISECHTNS